MANSIGRGIVALAGLADLAGTVLLVTSYHSHSDELSFLLELTFVMQALHVFTWFGALLVASGVPDKSFARMTFIAYIFAILLDATSSVLRIWVIGTSGLFLQVTMWASVSLFVADFLLLIFIWIEIKDKRPVDEMRDIRSPWTITIRTKILPLLWIIEVAAISLMLILYTAGLNRSSQFSKIILLEAPHLTLWLLHNAITGGFIATGGGIRVLGWITLGTLVSTGMALAGVAAMILRLYYIFLDVDSVSATMPIVMGWIQFSIGIVLFIVSVGQLLAYGSITQSESLEKEFSSAI